MLLNPFPINRWVNKLPHTTMGGSIRTAYTVNVNTMRSFYFLRNYRTTRVIMIPHPLERISKAGFLDIGDVVYRIRRATRPRKDLDARDFPKTTTFVVRAKEKRRFEI